MARENFQLLRDFLGDNKIPGSLALGATAVTVPSAVESYRLVKDQEKTPEGIRSGRTAAENGAQGALEGGLLALHDRKMGRLARRLAAYSGLMGGTDALMGLGISEAEKRKLRRQPAG